MNKPQEQLASQDISPVGPLHFMSWERFAAHAEQHVPDCNPEYYSTMYGNANRLIECLIHLTPTFVLVAMYGEFFSDKSTTIKSTIKFLKADVARRRAERFGPGVK